MLKKTIPIILVLLSCSGLFLGMTLTAKHFDLNHSKPNQATSILGFEAKCDQGGGCAEVNTSSYAKISLGEGRPAMPVSVPATGFFFMLALLAAACLWSGPRKARTYMALAATFCAPAVGFCLYLLVIQAFVIKKFCPYCLGLDLVTIASGVLAYIGHGGGVSGILADLKTRPHLPTLLCVAAMLLMNYRVYGMYTGWIDGADSEVSASSDTSTEDASQADEKAKAEAIQAVAQFITGYPAIEVAELQTNPFDGTKGNLEGGITVTEFADFECPHCKLAGFYLKDIAHRYGDRVGFVFKNYPLGTDCNENLKRDVHPDACEAAVGVQCAKRQGAFWAFHDATFDNQGDLGTSKLLSIAQQLGLERESFAECLEKDTVLEEVRTQVQQGRDADLTGTPTFFVNGRQLPNSHPLFVEAAIRYELTERGEVSLPEDPDGFFPR